MSNNARIVQTAIPVTETELGLTADVPNGWDDVKQLTNKVLEYRGAHFAFSGWNSDRNVVFFKRTNNIATLLK